MQNPSETKFLMGVWIAVPIALLIKTRNEMIFVTAILVTGKNSHETDEYMVFCETDTV